MRDLGNQEAAGTPVTSAQYKAAASAVQKWQTEADGNGDMYDMYLFVKVNKAAFYAVNFNTAVFTPGIRSMGSTAVQAQLVKALATWSQAQREAFYNNVVAYGMDWIFAQLIADLNAMATYVEMDAFTLSRGGILSPVRPFCITMTSIEYNAGFIGGLAMITGDEPVAAVAGLVAGFAMLGMGIGGCF